MGTTRSKRRVDQNRMIHLIALTVASLLLCVACGSGAAESGAQAEGAEAASIGAGTTDATETSEAAEGSAAVDYPVDRVQMIVPWAAGGGTDTMARLVAPFLGEELGVDITVVNREGGNSAVGNTAIATGPTDGSMIGLVTAELAMLHWQGLTEISHENVVPVGTPASNWGGITVAADAPYETVGELLEYVEEHPGELRGSGTGVGGIWHVGALGLLLEAGLPADAINWVPSEGGAPALQELLAGGIDISFASLPENSAQISDGAVRPLAIMADERDEENFPDVPTVKEEGIDWVVSAPFMLVAPEGTPDDIVATLEQALGAVAEDPEFLDRVGLFSPVWWDSAETASRLAEIDTTMGALLKEAGVAE